MPHLTKFVFAAIAAALAGRPVQSGIRSRTAVSPDPLRSRPGLSLPDARLLQLSSVPLQPRDLPRLHQDRSGRDALWHRKAAGRRLRRARKTNDLVVNSGTGDSTDAENDSLLVNGLRPLPRLRRLLSAALGRS